MISKIDQKIFTRFADFQSVHNSWVASGEKIVFTNGCFDLIHKGHIHYLAEASSLGDRLIVGLNSDASVKRLKGQHRPIKDISNRSLQLAAMMMIDAVIIFEEDDPLNLILDIKPNVLVKGGDWKEEDVVGAPELKAWGGKFHSLSFIQGESSTAIEAKIKDQNQ